MPARRTEISAQEIRGVCLDGFVSPHEKMKKYFHIHKKGLTNEKNGAIMYP